MRYETKNQDTIELFTTQTDETILTKPEVKTMEEDPLFTLFIQALGADAMQNPKKLKTSAEVWGKRADKLLKGIIQSSIMAK